MGEATSTVADEIITLNLDIGEVEFETIEELEDWKSKEHGFFNWLTKLRNIDGNASQAHNSINNFHTVINKFIQKYRQHQNNPQQQLNVKKQFENQCNQLFSKGNVCTSASPDAQFVERLRASQSDIVGGYALAYLLNIPSNSNSTDAIRGQFLALEYQKGSEGTVEAQQDALETTKRSWAAKFGKQYKALKEKNELLNSEISDLRDQFSTLQNDISKLHQSQKEEFGGLVENSEQELQSIEQTYDSKLALQSSVSYWSRKRKHHQDVMLFVGIATLFLAVLVGGGFIWAAVEFLSESFRDVPLWKLGLMAAISTFGIWLVRISAKIFISNLHLRTDADERVTMIQTYLALMREGQGPKDGERQLILQTLFRPSSTGFISDDGPANFTDLVSRLSPKK